MICYLFLLFCYTVVEANHFDGGTIRWAPVDPYDNSSSITITIIQSYWWTYPTIKCANDVPITTSGRSTQNSNLTCVADCSTDGGYSTEPINILTDCTSVSSALGMLTSERSVNITLDADAHFYLAYVGSSWVSLGSPAKNGLQWSILTFIDLRMRSDGFINTPPVASIISPQYVVVNTTTQIEVSVSDANVNDDVRCRWSIYTTGYRRRRQNNEDLYDESTIVTSTKSVMDDEVVLSRVKRACLSKCTLKCRRGCACTCPMCLGTSCTGSSCTAVTYCLSGTTTVDTPGTLKSTSSYPTRQAIDECGGICYPNSMPNGTTLSGCTLSFTGLVPNTWYAAAMQVEDFIDVNSTTPMSSVPIQFLIYVMPAPDCSDSPVIRPLTRCLDVTVGVSIKFDLYVLNLCDPNTANIADIVVSSEIPGMQKGNLTISPTNTSLAYVTFTWTPQVNQIGSQQMCAIAYTDEQVQSTEYCVTFNVTTSLAVCVTTTTTTTSTTRTSTTTTTKTSTTRTSTTATTTSVSTVTTSTSSVTTSTSTTTTSTSTAITSASTLTTLPSTISTSSSIGTTISTSSSTGTTISTTVGAAIVYTTTTKDSGKGTNWGLIGGILAAALLLALCACCCLYHLLWKSASKRLRPGHEAEDELRYKNLSSSSESSLGKTSNMDESFRIRKPSKSYQVYNIFSNNDTSSRIDSPVEGGSSILVSIYNNTNARRSNGVRTPNTKQSFEMGDAWMQPQKHEEAVDSTLSDPKTTSKISLTNKMSSFKEADESVNGNRQSPNQGRFQVSSTLFSRTDSCNSFQSSSNKTTRAGRAHSTGGTLFDFGDLARRYILGNGRQTRASHV